MNVSALTDSDRRWSVRTRPLVRRLHRSSAVLLGAFGVLHLFNHAFILAGPEAHQRVMEVLRLVYRTALGELLLYAAISVQVASGWGLLRRKRGPGSERRWQRYSGAFLAFFLVAHGLAAQYQRHVVGLESNAYWAAAVLVWPWALWFVPYYVLGTVSFVVHAGAAVSLPPKRAAWCGVVLAAFIVLGFAGIFHAFEVPADFRH